MNLNALIKLFRIRPTLAWSFCGILIGISLAINQVGFNLNWDLLMLMLIGTVFIQGFIAHAVNDLADEQVDKITDIKGTGRFKILIDNLVTRNELSLFTISIILLTIYIALTIYKTLGLTIIYFYIIGLLAAILYSIEPFKLGWKPFAEWIIVFPVLNILVLATYYVATGSTEYTIYILLVTALFAVINISWFIISRIMDYKPDSINGKITTAVWMGIDKCYIYFNSFVVLSIILFIVLVLYNILYLVPFMFYLLSILSIKSAMIKSQDVLYIGYLRHTMIYNSIFSFICISLINIVTAIKL